MGSGYVHVMPEPILQNSLKQKGDDSVHCNKNIRTNFPGNFDDSMGK